MSHSTRIIGLREFRSRITSLWKEAKQKNISYIVLNHSKPIFHVEPISEKHSLESLVADIAEARQQIKEGKVFSEIEIRKMLSP